MGSGNSLEAKVTCLLSSDLFGFLVSAGAICVPKQGSMLGGNCLGALGSSVLGYLYSGVCWSLCVWDLGDSRAGYSQMLCKLTSSRRVLAPRGFTSVTLIRYWLQNSAPWTTQRAAPGGSCGHGQGPVDGLVLGERKWSWALEMLVVGSSWSPQPLPHVLPLAISSWHCLLPSREGPSEVR